MKLVFILTLLLTGQAFAFEIIAHRGLPRLHPEHSLLSLEQALTWKPDYVEPDVVLTKDGEAIILHDTHIDTTTNVADVYPDRKRKDGRYYAIDFTLKELSQLRVNHRIDLKTGKAAFKTRQPIGNSELKIPTFKQFVTTVVRYNQKNKTNIGIYPEIKAPEFHLKEGQDIAKIVHDELINLRKLQPKLPIILQCFHQATVKRIATEFKSPFTLVQLVAENSWGETSTDYDQLKSEKGLKELRKYASGLGPWIPQIVNEKGQPTEFLKQAKKLGFKIHPYTLRNDALPSQFKTEKQLLKTLKDDLGVDGVFTDNVNTTVPLMKTL